MEDRRSIVYTLAVDMVRALPSRPLSGGDWLVMAGTVATNLRRKIAQRRENGGRCCSDCLVASVHACTGGDRHKIQRLAVEASLKLSAIPESDLSPDRLQPVLLGAEYLYTALYLADAVLASTTDWHWRNCTPPAKSCP